jgi:hypothetical protein
MKPAPMPWFLAPIILIGTILSGMPAILASSQSDSIAALGNTKRIAASQHEYVLLLIKHKEYDQAEKEACKIFEMKWPDDQESLLLTELLMLSDQFLRHGRPSIGLHLIERNARSFKQTASQIAILKEKGFLYKSLNQDDKALEFFRKAQELEDKSAK